MTNPWLTTQRQTDEQRLLALTGKVNGLMVRLNPNFPTGAITQELQDDYDSAVIELNDFKDYMNTTYNLNY